jgi:hypothetical protein
LFQINYREKCDLFALNDWGNAFLKNALFVSWSSHCWGSSARAQNASTPLISGKWIVSGNLANEDFKKEQNKWKMEVKEEL